MHTSDTSPSGGAGRSIGGKAAVGIMIAAVVLFFFVVLLFGVSWYAWGLLGVIIVCVAVYSVARYGIRRAGGIDERRRS